MRRPSGAAPDTNEQSYRWIILATAFMGVFGALGFGRFGYSAVLPAMQTGLDINSAAAGSLASWNLIGCTLAAAVGGVLSQKLGQRKVITIGMMLTAAGVLATGFVQSLAGASAARLLTGIGNGLVLVPSISLMAAWFEPRRLGLASTIIPSGSSLTLVVGLAVPSLISAGGENGWRITCYVFAGVTFSLGLLSYLVLRDRPAGDGTGGLDDIQFDRFASPAIRSRLEAPSLNLRPVLRAKYAWHAGAIYLLYGIAFLLYFTFFQKRLITDLGYSSQAAGYLFILLGVSGLAGGMYWGSFSDRFGRERTLAASYLFSGAVFFAAGFAALLLPRGADYRDYTPAVLPELPGCRRVK